MRSVAGQVLLLQVVVVLLVVVAAVTFLVLHARRDGTQEAEQRSFDIAVTFAQAPGAVRALDTPDPVGALQPRAEAIRRSSGVDYIVVFSTQGIRYTHPDPDRIGEHVIGSYDEALEGRTITTTFTGSLGPAVDTTAPIVRPDGTIAGIVSVGITVESLQGALNRQLPVLIGSAVGALALAAAGTALVSRRLRKQTHGLDPAEMTRMYEHHDAVLHAVREGVLIIGSDGRLLLANDEARRLLHLPPDADRRRVTELGLDAETTELLTSDGPVTDAVHPAAGRLLAVNKRSAALYGEPAGSVVTLRDSTELRALTGRAQAARDRLALLYEAGVRIGTTLDVVRTAQELADVAVPGLADAVTVDLLDAVIHGEEPGRAGGQVRRAAVGGLREDLPLYPVGELITFMPATPQVRALESGRPVLRRGLDRDEGFRTQDARRAERVLAAGVHSLIAVPLRARGAVLGLATFWRAADSPAFDDEDVSVTEELAARAAVAIDNARRFTREHAMAVTLQRSLLPRGVPEQNALDVAWRYLPAQAGVGGDWFDVIPLPGARVALVVGDVVGHGLHAAATMGRLRTAVHNFSALDLPPDELLGRLDELVARIDQDEGDDAGGITGATCLYAVYDPVTGSCTVARAGHFGPVVMRPDGTVDFPEVPVSPPLGLSGSLPFECAELHLPEGSRLVLHTDGLVEDRARDIDTGLEQLRTSLAAAADRTPDGICQAVIDTMLPDRAGDDIALLVARTHLLDPGKVADWDVPPDPAAVAPVRAQCGERLREWGLEEIGYSTELILSELITNAIRYGSPPIHVRLLLDRSLICEVSDASSTSPHLRRAATTDEGGRGLFLVAHLCHRWGTRYTPRGKVIWTEQPPHDGGPPATDGSSTTGESFTDIFLDAWDDSPL
ncbi:SpoIIE family protein phosphatase [Streptomyces sp. NPDC006368]|uniref:SpoIIE family protein phosphatase n=1 Tax=Streptomyces sp. NPDC006368 TaxID=3156760 RepID=UPI0033B447BB